MASLTRLLRGGSMVPDGAGGFTFKLDSKFKWDTKKLRKKIGAANAKALKIAGSDVRKAAQKGMSSRVPKAPKQWNITKRHGLDFVALVTKVPKADVVTSWQTWRSPKGELRQSIEYDYDYKKESVAIGPSAERMRPAVSKILELGGTTTHYFIPVFRNPEAKRRNVIFGILRNSRPRIRKTRIAQLGLYSFQRTVKGRGFMAKGLAKALPKIPERYRNTVTGP